MNQQTSYSDQITTAFDRYQGKGRAGDKITLAPEIKVKRSHDTIYISEVRKTKINTMIATVEVHNGKIGDKAPMPLTALDDVAQKQILIRLKMHGPIN